MSIFREFELPGFRFHPTEQELLDFYLLNTVTGNPACFDIIGFLNIYHYDPGQLPKLAMHGEREWYFFVPRDRKIGGSGGRPKRTTGNGFWKATGLDRKIISLTGHKRVIGHKKTLVFYQGKAPQGKKTDWIMNEYRLPDNSLLSKEVVLCKIYRKAIPLKVMEERAAMEESLVRNGVFQSQVIDLVLISVNHQQQDMQKELVGGASVNMQNVGFKMEEEDEGGKVEDDVKRERVAEECVFEREKLAEIQVPKLNLEWTQDAFWSQLDSPWLPNLTPNFANIINLY